MFRPNEWMGISVLGDWLQPKYLDIKQLKLLENCTNFVKYQSLLFLVWNINQWKTM